VQEAQRQVNVFLSRLNEAQRRWYVGLVSHKTDSPTDVVLSQITGLDGKTIRRGRREIKAGLVDMPPGRQRRAGGGRPRAEKKTQISKRW
jgi:hypothetical protein